MLYGYLNSPFVSNPFSDAAIPPTSLTSPVIFGSGVVGQTLSTTNGTWSGTLPITYSYQWNRNGSIIVGATNNTYVLVTADGSTSITCTVKATNAGGFASSTSNAISVAAAGDADANAFIAAAAITDTTQKAAIDKLVVDLKGYGIWSKMKALYPFVGGTASQHKFNLKNPLDTNAAYRLTFSGGWTHNSNGISGNSINTTSSTFLAANSVLTAANGSLSVYCRNTINENGYDIAYNEFGIALYGSTSYFMWGDGFPSVNRPATRGFYQLNRLSSITNAKFNTTTILTNASVGAVNSNIISIGSNGSTASYSSRNYAFASIGNGLTDTEANNYYTAVQAFQTTLGRNVI